jgi:hypothetical protein
MIPAAVFLLKIKCNKRTKPNKAVRNLEKKTLCCFVSLVSLFYSLFPLSILLQHSV